MSEKEIEKMSKTGWYWHIYHDKLLNYCYDYDKRVEYIVKYKPLCEQALRLRLFKEVKGKLPIDLIESFNKSWRGPFSKSWKAYLPQIEALHDVECPNCPWNGETIFREDVT